MAYKGPSIPSWANTTDHIPSKNSDNVTGGYLKDTREKLSISENYTVVPICNKGAYQVISKDEIKTAGRKV